MLGSVTQAYQRLEEARPLVRPTHSQLEVSLLPPYGDPEVHILAEVGTYIAAGIVINSVAERLAEE